MSTDDMLKKFLADGGKIQRLDPKAKSPSELGRGTKSSYSSIDRLYKQVHKSQAYGRMKAKKP